MDATKKCCQAQVMVLLTYKQQDQRSRWCGPVLERTGGQNRWQEVKLPSRSVCGLHHQHHELGQSLYLEPKVTTEGAVESTTGTCPNCAPKGADVVLAVARQAGRCGLLAHHGETPGLYLSKVAGIDAMVMGHLHGVFPRHGSHAQLQPAGVDHKAGTPSTACPP